MLFLIQYILVGVLVALLSINSSEIDMDEGDRLFIFFAITLWPIAVVAWIWGVVDGIAKAILDIDDDET